MFTFWLEFYRLQRVAAYSAVSDSTTFMRYADHGLNGTVVIPQIAGC
jgi:hypothetical protein